MYLRKQGPGEVTAADIAPPAGVEVHNPELDLATLNDKGKLDMELAVERGRGYVSAVQNKSRRDRPDAGRLDLLAGPQGDLQGRGDPCRAAHRLRPAHLDVETKPSMQPHEPTTHTWGAGVQYLLRQTFRIRFTVQPLPFF